MRKYGFVNTFLKKLFFIALYAFPSSQHHDQNKQAVSCLLLSAREWNWSLLPIFDRTNHIKEKKFELYERMREKKPTLDQTWD